MRGFKDSMYRRTSGSSGIDNNYRIKVETHCCGKRRAFMAQSRLKASFRALQNRNYRLFFAGQLTSLVGTWTQTMAQSWLVYRMTHSATQLGLIAFASQIPIFLLSPVAGAVADMYPRRRTMIVIQSLMMLLSFPLAALTLMNRIQVWQIMV